MMKRLSVPFLRAALAAALLLAASAARADLWGYTDKQGITHLAARRVDARYSLFVRGAGAARLDPAAPALGLSPLGAHNSASGASAASLRRFGRVNYSAGYRAVRQHISEAAQKHKVDYALIKAVIAAESGFNPYAVSPKGATGLMQLMPDTARQYGLDPDREGVLTDARTNILAGTRHLARLIRRFQGDTRLAVAAYNAGEGAVQRAGGVPNYPETRNYVDIVLGLYQLFLPGDAEATGLKPSTQSRRGKSRTQPAAAAAQQTAAASIGQGSSGRVRVQFAAPAAAASAPKK